jgi:hypothetical protein
VLRRRFPEHERQTPMGKKRHATERSEQRFTYTRRKVKFVWEGGAYIELFFGSGGPGDVPFEVINVWDCEHNKSALERDRGAFVAECEAWLEATPPEEIDNYRYHHRQYMRSRQ